MTILGIETSCDETAISLIEHLEGRVRILGDALVSQTALHRPYGGVHPFMAKRAHQENLPRIYREALGRHREEDIDRIAVTQGPGLSPCLWQGIEFAKDIQRRTGAPIVPTNHVEGHILLPLLQEDGQILPDAFPALALVVSGGHTELVLAERIGRYRILGETADDAAGECLDKTARLLGLDYPGGPAIAEKAGEWASRGGIPANPPISLPRPMMNRSSYEFSFSGLKTAVLYDWQSRPESVRQSPDYVREMAFEIQRAVVDVLVAKTARGAESFPVRSVIIGGGVSANTELRARLRKALPSLRILAAPPSRSTDNGLMPALTAVLRPDPMLRPGESSSLAAAPSLRIE